MVHHLYKITSTSVLYQNTLSDLYLKYFQFEINSCQDVFINELQLGVDIAKNRALKENVFMMIVCIELGIPLFVVGKPGSSKSLAKTVVADAMIGTSSPSPLFKKLKRVCTIIFPFFNWSSSMKLKNVKVELLRRCKISASYVAMA